VARRITRHALRAPRRLTSTALGALCASQDTTHGRSDHRPLDTALLSSGNVHIPDECAKSTNHFEKTPRGAAPVKVSPTDASNCDLRKNRKRLPGARKQGLLDAHAQKRRAELPAHQGRRIRQGEPRGAGERDDRAKATGRTTHPPPVCHCFARSSGALLASKQWHTAFHAGPGGRCLVCAIRVN